jgi:hypothetical protein
MVHLRLQDIKAVPHPLGNCVEVRWLNPAPHLYKGVRVMRSDGSYCTSPEKDVAKYKVGDIAYSPHFTIPSPSSAFEKDLDDRIISISLWSAFEFQQIVLTRQAEVSVQEPGNRWLITDGKRKYLVVKVSTESEVRLDVYLLEVSSLPDAGLRSEVVYYYAFFPYKHNPSASGRREYIFDRNNRTSAMSTAPYDFGGLMHRMLPAIYHRYDTDLPAKQYESVLSAEDMQRGQLRRFLDLPGSQLDQFYSFATAALNFHDIRQVDGKLLPLLAQWIGWDTDYTLEIAGQRNELRSAPEMYRTIGIIPNIEAAVVKCISGWEMQTKEFVHNVFRSNTPEQLNLWQCRRNEEGEWQEDAEVFSLDAAYDGRPAAVRDQQNTLWLFYHTFRPERTLKKLRWDIWFKTYEQEYGWSPSQPLTHSCTIDKYPAVACQNEFLWVFWSSYDETEQAWSINYRKRTGERWLSADDLKAENKTVDILSASPNQRKNPCAVVDHEYRLWLFWLEKERNRWFLKYIRHNKESGWDPEPTEGFPVGDRKDLFVLFHSDGTDHNFWLFWSQRKTAAVPGKLHWEIAFCKKPVAGDWDITHSLPKAGSDENYHDVEPAAIVAGDGKIQLCWSSNRTGSWSMWKTEIDMETAAPGELAVLVDGPYSRCNPLPLELEEGEISVLYRSNRSITYQSDIYCATGTTDFRNAGCTTVDIRNEDKIELARYKKYGDFLTYTYDIGKNGEPTNDDWFARDTIGLYLTPDTDDQQLITRNRELVKGVLKRFLPAQVRLVFIISPPIVKEWVYTYDYDFTKELEEDKKIKPRYIKELFFDSTIPEICPRVSDSFEKDIADGWVWMHSWSAAYQDHLAVDFKTLPANINHRTWHKALKAGG